MIQVPVTCKTNFKEPAAPSAGALNAFFFFNTVCTVCYTVDIKYYLVPECIFHTLLNIFLLVLVIGPEADIADTVL